MKKLTSVFLCVVMLMSVLCVPTQAADTEDCLKVIVSANKYDKKIDLTFVATENTTNGRFSVEFDSDLLTIEAYDIQGLLTETVTDDGRITFSYATTSAAPLKAGEAVASLSFSMTTRWALFEILVTVLDFNDLENLNLALPTITLDYSFTPPPAPEEPEDPSDPVEPEDPTDPVEPEDPTDPVEPEKEVVDTKEETDEEGNVTETVTYDDGSTTVTETKVDGSTTVTETEVDGSTTVTETKVDGSTAVTETKADGTVIETNTTSDGTSATKTTDAEGKVTEVKATVSEEAAAEAEVVTIPVEVSVAQKAEEAVAVEITVPETVETVTIEIPVENVTAGTVIYVIDADANVTILPTTAMTEDGLSFTVSGNVTVKVVDNTKEFVDTEGNWAAEQITFVTARELFKGTGEGKFSPEEKMTRAMLMTVLARLDGLDTDAGATWYEVGMNWAVEQGISDGTDPDGNITREQLVTMLYRYAGKPATNGSLDAFSDAADIHDWPDFVDAMKWAVEVGIINGNPDGTLDPQGYALREQLAKIMMYFINL